jgi:Na+(H+)/acetate symporter ActP
LVIASALVGLLGVVAGVLAMIATAIARFLMQELCEPERTPAITRVEV